ncbi:MAG: ComEC/Rec2 family competence protein [Candidatus Bathyarchaeia archaeon]
MAGGFRGFTAHLRRLVILLMVVMVDSTVLTMAAAYASAPMPASGPALPSSGFLKVYFLDVGQGDSALVSFPSGAAMLIDGGEQSMGPRIVEFLRSLGLSSLDVVVATHPHSDHIGGLITVLERFNVGLVVDSGQVHPTRIFEDYLKVIDERNIPFRVGREGDRLDLDPEVQVIVMSPPAVPFKDTGSDLDANCLVLKVIYGRVSFLFTGDIGGEAESHLSRLEVDVDVLKVAHHGGRSSSGSRFLQAVTPLVAVISVGADNPYGHPSREVLDRLASAGAAVYRTDLNGGIEISTDGYSILVSAERGVPAQAYTKWEGQVFKVTLTSNSEISDYMFIQPARQIRFNVSGEAGTRGSLEVSLPTALLGPPYKVYFDGEPVEAEVDQAGPTASIRIEYTHSRHMITIAGASAVPEIPYPRMPLMFALAVAAAALMLFYAARGRGVWRRR